MDKKKYLVAMKKRDFVFALSLLGREVETVEDPELYYNFAICCSRTGNHKKCITVLKDLLTKFPRFIEKENIYRLLIYSYIFVKNFPLALDLIEERLKLNLADEKLLSFKAYILEHSGKIEEAIEVHRNILKLNPEYLNSLNSIAYLLVHERKASKEEFNFAIDAIKKALTIANKNPAYLDTFGIILEKSGKIAEAKKALQRALSFAPAESVTLDHLESLSFD